MTEGARGRGQSGRRAPGDAPGRRGRDDQFVVRALARGLTVLNLFDAEHREWSLDEMAAPTGLPQWTVPGRILSVTLAARMTDPRSL